MLYWTNYPFLRILFAFIAGIFMARYSNPADLIQINPFLPLSLFIAISLGKLTLNRISNTVWGNLLLTTTFIIGFSHMQSHSLSSSQSNPNSDWTECEAYVGTISSFPIHKEKYIIHEVEVNTGIKDSAILQSPTKLLLYVKRSDSYPSGLKYGDKIRIEGTPGPIRSPRNPHEFDFSAYMANRSIFLQHFVYQDQIHLISSDNGNGLMKVIYQIRSRFEQIITEDIHDSNEQAVVMALLLGIKGQLDHEIKSAYASAGAMHVLAVSGLHVSIVCFILNWLFKLLPSGKSQRVIAPVASISALWIYAVLTGFSPSILRAVSMFSIILISKILNRRTHACNSLAFAAFVLLLFNPLFLFDVGFQLSFLAVAGILYLYPKISSVWNVTNWFGKWVWQLTCVSLAAQLATFPLGLYYFHQFPSYFLLTNLIVIPAAFIVMILGIGLIVIGSWFDWIGWLLEHTAFGLNLFVQQIQILDGSVIERVFISPLQVVLIYALMVAFLALLSSKKSYYMWLIICSALGITLDRSIRLIEQSNKKELLFYSINKDQLVDQVTGLSAKLFTLDSIKDAKVYQKRIAPFRLRHFLPYPDSVFHIDNGLSDFAKIQVLHKKKILYFIQPFDSNQISYPLKADIVVIANQSFESLAQLSQTVTCDKIILDNSNKREYSSRLKIEALDLGIEIVDLKDHSYLISQSGNKKFLNMFF